MNVRFFGGHKEDYLGIAKHNPIGLYFCADTRELFWGDWLLSDGIRVVPTFADLPSISKHQAAEGVIYFVEETKNGYVFVSGRSDWLQVIYAPTEPTTPEVDLSGYYSKVEVDEAILSAITNIKLPEIDLTGYATETYVDEKVAAINIPEVPSRVGELENDAGYITAKDIPETDLSDYYNKAETENLITEAVESIEYPTVDLNGYATEAYVNEAVSGIRVPDVSNFITMEEVEAKGYINEVPSEYVTESELEDKGYLTEHQDLSKYALKTDIPTDYLKAVPTEYITETELAEELAKIEHPSVDLTGYATEQFVSEAIAEIKIPDVSDFVTMSEVEAKGYITGVPAEYVTETELTAKGFITDISGKADVEHRHTLSDIEDYSAPDLSDYAKKTDIPDVTGFIKEIPAEYVTETELTNKGYLTEHQSLEAYAKKDELFSKSYNDLTDKPEIPSIDGLATEDFVKAEIEKIDIPSIDTNNFVTTEIFNNALAVKANEVPFTSAKFITKPFGDFTYGENLKNLSIAEILAKLLGLVDNDPNVQEPDSIVENIVENEIPMYSVTADGTLEEVPYKLLTFTEDEAAAKPSESGFYQIKDASGNVIESGYQELQADSGDVYYIIALPKAIDFNTIVDVQAYSIATNSWMPDDTVLTSDAFEVAALCEEAEIDISHIDTNIYTIWALDETPTGRMLRFTIKE